MAFTIVRYESRHAVSWDRFVEDSNNGTLFHLRRFLAYHEEREFHDHSLIVRHGERPVALFPAAEIRDGGQRVLYSHPGASFGGFVYDKLSFAHARRVLSVFRDYCREQAIDRVTLVSPPIPYMRRPEELMPYVLHRAGFTSHETYVSGAIDLGPPSDDLIRTVARKKSRSRAYFDRLIREHRTRFEWCDDFETYYPILQRNRARHGVAPTHTLAELERLKSLLPDRVHLLLMFRDDTPVGGTLVFVANPRTAIVFYNMIDHEYSSCQPATLQILETMRWCKLRGIRFLDLGVSQDSQSSDELAPSLPLIRFKEELGAQVWMRSAFTLALGRSHEDEEHRSVEFESQPVAVSAQPSLHSEST